MSSEYIPFEIQEEILKRLPIKSILQFRSVSKSYNRLIDSPDFIVSYGVRKHPDDRFILRYAEYNVYCAPIEDKFVTLVDNYDDNFVQREFQNSSVPDLIKKIDDTSVVGSSRGLLCFKGVDFDCPDSEIKETVVLWNPSVRKSVGIQVTHLYDEIAFWVCPVTFDPTILTIEYVHYNEENNNIVDLPDNVSRVWIFTLSTGTWSILSTHPFRESFQLRGYQVIIDRFIYWLAFDRLHFLIMSFDLIAKEFKEINLTGCLTKGLCSIECISKFRESLVFLGYHREFAEDPSVCSLWMMMEQGVSRSFIKLYNIINLLPNVTINHILGFRKTYELILETQNQDTRKAKLKIYDPNSKVIHNLGIDGDNHSFFMCSYMETLLLFNQLDGFIYSFSY